MENNNNETTHTPTSAPPVSEDEGFSVSAFAFYDRLIFSARAEIKTSEKRRGADNDNTADFPRGFSTGKVLFFIDDRTVLWRGLVSTRLPRFGDVWVENGTWHHEE